MLELVLASVKSLYSYTLAVFETTVKLGSSLVSKVSTGSTTMNIFSPHFRNMENTRANTAQRFRSLVEFSLVEETSRGVLPHALFAVGGGEEVEGYLYMTRRSSCFGGIGK